MDDLDVNVAIWGIFLNATLRAAVHLGQDHEAKKKNLWNSVGQLFNETGKQISEQKEIIGVSTIKFKDATWMSTSLLCEKAYRITNAQVHVFSDSVSVYVDDINLARKKRNIYPMWKVLNKEVDLGEPTSFLDHVYLVCTQRQCEISKDSVDNYRTMFESRNSAGATEKLPCSENLRISSWSYDMAGHAKKCVELYCELAIRTTQQLYKVSTPCINDHHFKEELKSVGELSKVCSQIVLKC